MSFVEYEKNTVFSLPIHEIWVQFHFKSMGTTSNLLHVFNSAELFSYFQTGMIVCNINASHVQVDEEISLRETFHCSITPNQTYKIEAITDKRQCISDKCC